MEKHYKIGYTAGVYDLFHVGNLRLLQRAKQRCDCLIVGVTVDELMAYKGRKATIPFEERLEIISALKCVDMAVPQTDINKVKAWEKYHYDVLFVGDDWKGHPTWVEYEHQLKEKGVDVIYFPYTRHVSSTLLRAKIVGDKPGM